MDGNKFTTFDVILCTFACTVSVMGLLIVSFLLMVSK